MSEITGSSEQNGTPSAATWVGIDVGTQSVRVQLLDERGLPVGAGAAPLRSQRGPRQGAAGQGGAERGAAGQGAARQGAARQGAAGQGAAGQGGAGQGGLGRRHEQEPADWWAATIAALAAAGGAPALRAVRALAICSTSGTILLTDRAGRPLTPGVMYDDDRGAPHAERVADVGRELWDELGLRMQASWALPKLLTLLDDPQSAQAAPKSAQAAPATAQTAPASAQTAPATAQTAPATAQAAPMRVRAEAGDLRLMHSADYLASRFAGAPTATDPSHALKSGYDALRQRWPVELLERLGVPGAILPPVVPAGTRIGTVCAEAAAATGLPPGAAIVAGMTDGCAAQIAAGALAPGQGVSVLGTTLVLKGVSRALLKDPHGAVYSHRSPDGDWLPGGASNVGAGILSARFPGRDLAALDAAAAAREPAGQLVYPLTARGERFPFYDPHAEAFAIGDARDEADAFAALLQGVAFVERIGVAALAALGAPLAGPLALTGGATRSRYWCQLRADVLRRPVELPRHPEGAHGMAMLAAATERDSLRATVAELLPPPTRIEPRPDGVDRLAPAFDRFAAALAERGWIAPDLAAAAAA